MYIFLGRKIKHEIFVCGKMHILKGKTLLCFGTSCMQVLVFVSLLPCARWLICLFDHTNFLLGIFVAVLTCKYILHLNLQLLLMAGAAVVLWKHR